MTKTEALALRENVRNMGPEEKRDWYKAEKEKRKAENKLAKRTFSQPKGQVVQSNQRQSHTDSNIKWDTFEDFAIRQISLRRCKDEEDAIPLWENAIGASGALTMEKNGRRL